MELMVFLVKIFLLNGQTIEVKLVDPDLEMLKEFVKRRYLAGEDMNSLFFETDGASFYTNIFIDVREIVAITYTKYDEDCT